MLLKPIINRVRGVLLEPKREFVSILTENKSRGAVLSQYIIPFLVLFLLATFLGSVVFGPTTFREGSGVVLRSIFHLILVVLVTLYGAAYILNELLPVFQIPINGTKTFTLVAYAFTPVYVAMVLSGLLPKLEALLNLIGLYSIILFWVGTERLIEMPVERRQWFVPISLAIIILLYLAAKLILGAIFAL